MVSLEISRVLDLFQINAGVDATGFDWGVEALVLAQADPAENFGMAVRHGEDCGLAMMRGRRVLPDGGTGEVGFHREVTVIDGLLALVDEHEGAARGGVLDLAGLGVEFVEGTEHPAGVRAAVLAIATAHATAHGEGANQTFAALQGSGVLEGGGGFLGSGAAVDGDGRVVEEELGVPNVGFVGGPDGIGDIATDPSIGGAEPVFHQFIAGIGVVHDPAQTELAGVVEALDGDSLGLGLGERGEQHAGKDGDDGNHDEKFDQREGVVSARPHGFGKREGLHKLGYVDGFIYRPGQDRKGNFSDLHAGGEFEATQLPLPSLLSGIFCEACEACEVIAKGTLTGACEVPCRRMDRGKPVPSLGKFGKWLGVSPPFFGDRPSW